MHAIVCKRRKTLKSFDFLKNICHKMTMSFSLGKHLFWLKNGNFRIEKRVKNLGIFYVCIQKRFIRLLLFKKV